MPQPAQLFREDGLLLYANPAWEKLWSVPAASIVNLYNAFEVEQYEQMGLKKLMQKVREGETVRFPDFELDPQRLGLPGRSRWIRAWAYPIMNKKTTHMVVINEDITEQIAMHTHAISNQQKFEQTINELHQTQKQLVMQERLSAIGQLSAGIAHDFNNILAVILLQSQLLQRQNDLPPDVRSRLNTIAEQSNKGAHLIQQILDFSRKSVIHPQPLDLKGWLYDFIDLMRRTLSATISIEYRHLEQECTIEADPASLQQVFMNLAFNARDAIGGNGRLSFTLDWVPSQPEKFRDLVRQKGEHGYARVKVTDDGSGMSSETLERIFEPFFTTKTVGEGAGLGLAQAYGIVKQHYGFIDCESQPGKGSTFLLYLPLTTKKPSESDSAKQHDRSGNREVILLVEDHPSTRKTITDTLKALNYSVIIATNGREALEILTTHHDEIQVVLSDIVMPELGGIALRKEIHSSYPNIKVILMSGYAFKSDEVRDDAMLNMIWLQKPFTIETISTLLRNTLHD